MSRFFSDLVPYVRWIMKVHFSSFFPKRKPWCRHPPLPQILWVKGDSSKRRMLCRSVSTKKVMYGLEATAAIYSAWYPLYTACQCVENTYVFMAFTVTVFLEYGALSPPYIPTYIQR
ncbi:unnamed protein product, partial [Choristocarpus tenellus]